MGLNITSVTPMVNSSGAGGTGGEGTTGAVASVPSAVTVAAGEGAGVGFGAGAATMTTVNLLYSNKGLRKSTRSFVAFFSTIAHLTPFSSSNSWFLLMAIVAN